MKVWYENVTGTDILMWRRCLFSVCLPQVRPTLSVIAASNLAFNAFLITLDVQSDNGMTRWKKAPIEAHRLSQARAVNRFIFCLTDRFSCNWLTLCTESETQRTPILYILKAMMSFPSFVTLLFLSNTFLFLLSNSWNFTLRILAVSNQNYVLLVLTLGDTEFSQFGLHSQGKFICKVI